MKIQGFGEIERLEVHYFGDASLDGYGACAYLRMFNKLKQIHVALITAKSRVIPSKGLTVPRLELQAAVEAVRLAAFVRTELQLEINQEYFWIDSTATLGYIKNDDRQFYMFTTNRVEDIRQLSSPEHWYHIPGNQNPADIVSRGASATELAASNWYDGPRFLQQEDITCYLQSRETIDFENVIQNSPEVRPPAKVTLTSESRPEPFISPRLLKNSAAGRTL